MVIAIDGPAGAGKSTVARGVADALGLTYLDSGAMYRCVALECLDRGIELSEAAAAASVAESVSVGFVGEQVLLDGRDVSDAIRSPRVSEAASLVSAHAGVRTAMVAEQRRLIGTGAYVAEGRDIGTVVSPESPLKIFLNADESTRAERRAAQTGEDASAVLAAQRRRDQRDRERSHGALRVAEDAVEIDTTGVSAEQVVDRIAAIARERGLT